MAVVNLSNMRNILMVGLRMTPEERAAAKAKSDAHDAAAGAKEHAYYLSLSDAERQEYDDLTYSMMPRLAGAQEYWAKRNGDSPTGGRR